MKKAGFVLLAAVLLAGQAFAQAVDTSAVEGEIRKIDKSAKKITIRHGEIQSLDMPGMTMVFQAGDPADLDRFKVGDKIRFKAERNTGGALTASEIQPVPK